jgi:hypothetical protein
LLITLIDIYGEALGSINSPVHTVVVKKSKLGTTELPKHSAQFGAWGAHPRSFPRNLLIAMTAQHLIISGEFVRPL